jgi:hypothetical protein
LFDIARGGMTLGWNGHYVHEVAKNPEGVVSGSRVKGLGSGVEFVRLQMMVCVK